MLQKSGYLNNIPASTSEFIIKKKANNYENEVFKSQQLIPHLPREYGDRFIPRRYSTNKNVCIESSFNLNEFAETIDILRQKRTDGYYRMFSYKENLRSILDIYVPKNILNFHEKMSACQRVLNYGLPMVKCIMERRRNAEGLDWPCKPRSMPLAYNNSTHDLPEFYDHSDLNIISWSNSGRIAASFRRDLVLWIPPATMDTKTTGCSKSPLIYKGGFIRSLAFSKNGEILALGIHEKDNLANLQLWQFTCHTGLTNAGTYSFRGKSGKIDIRAIEFDPSGNNIICGMSCGKIYMIKYPLVPDVKIQVCSHHTSVITNIKYSTQHTYVGVVDKGGKFTIRHSQSFFGIYFELDEISMFAWHPWNETDLFVGMLEIFEMRISETRRAQPAKIILLDLTTKAEVAYYQRADQKFTLDAISLNPLSAELLASFTCEDESCELLVLASMDRVVDHLTGHSHSVKFLLWSPDGSYLATAGDDEALNIWSFFGKSHRKLKELSHRQKKSGKYECCMFDLGTAFLDSR